MRIAYFVHGRGRGHASRSVTVMERLTAEGCEVFPFGGGDAWSLLQYVPRARSVDPVLPGKALWSVTSRRVREDRERLRKLAIDVVISDGDMPSVFAARSLGIRCISIGHDLVFSRCTLPKGLSLCALLEERLNGFHTAFAPEGVAVNFLPLESACAKTVVARPDFRPDFFQARNEDGHIVAYFRDANGADVARALSQTGREVQLFCPKGDRHRGLNVRPLCRAAFAESMSTASAVVGSVGSNLVAESIALGKPFLGLHRKGDAEQSLNAQMVAAAGVGMVTTFEGQDPLLARRFLKRVEARSFRRVDMMSMRTASDAMMDVLRAQH